VNPVTVEPIREVDLHADAAVAGPRILVRLAGSADLNLKARLDRFITDVHALAVGNESEDVLVDLRSLDFLSSSCLSSFVTWVARLDEKNREQDDKGAKEDHHRYRIVLRANLSQRWQRRSLPALVSFGAGYVTLEAEKPLS
jgi:hypothetical protein